MIALTAADNPYRCVANNNGASKRSLAFFAS